MGIILGVAGALCAGFFIGRTLSRAVLSKEEVANPPINHVLALHGRSDLVPCFQNILKSNNTKAMESVKQQLYDLGLDHISDAFVKGYNTKMVCTKCAKKLEHIDGLCYCTEAANKCHHRNCCSVRNNRALTYY
ncbi:hypothetical protein niasHT_013072 [Heterodera trifolii]|uniref:Uncharacterized protein n=1 Tax=Heterodera trifolii TaxID=157864 RepID=A0ABD2L7B7_9BILA